jgi:probable rRNA maturation factor
MKEFRGQKGLILDISQEGLCDFDRPFFERVAEKTLELSRYTFGKNSTLSLSVEVVSKREIVLLNKQYRGKNIPTDILSFPTFSEEVLQKMRFSESIFFGEIIMCPDVIREDARKDGVSYAREMTFVFSHGILHLLGYEHSEEMFALQDKVCDNEK